MLGHLDCHGRLLQAAQRWLLCADDIILFEGAVRAVIEGGSGAGKSNFHGNGYREALARMKSWHLDCHSSLLEVPQRWLLRADKIIFLQDAVHAVVDGGLMRVVVSSAKGLDCPRPVPDPSGKGSRLVVIPWHPRLSCALSQTHDNCLMTRVDAASLYM